MGSGPHVRAVTAQDGTRMPAYQLGEYNRTVYDPQIDFRASLNAPIPGVSWPTAPAGDGLLAQPVAPPPQFQTAPTMSPQPFAAVGPYGSQAAQLAGLLQAPASSQPQSTAAAPPSGGMGLLGMGKRPWMPGGK